MKKCVITVDGDKYIVASDSGSGEFSMGGTIGEDDLGVDGEYWSGECPVEELVKFIDGIKIIVGIFAGIDYPLSRDSDEEYD